MKLSFREKLVNKAVLLMVMASSTVAMAQPLGDDYNYFHEWCDRVVTQLNSALYVGSRADEDAEERTILLSAIDQALSTTGKRHRKIFNHTLNIAKTDEVMLAPDTSRQVAFLRETIVDAISDLYFIDRWSDNSDDTIYYSRLILSRARDLGLRVMTNKLEILFLKRGLQRSLQFLEGSDYRRLPSNACAAKIMKNALEAAENNTLSDKVKVLILREAADSAQNSIYYGCN